MATIGLDKLYYAKITEDDIAIATNKGWTITA